MRRIASLLLPGLILAAGTTSASAQKVESTFFNSDIPWRIDSLIGFTPTTNGIHPNGKPVKPIAVRESGRSYRFVFSTASAAVAPDITPALRSMTRYRRYPTPVGAFVDRRLTARERKVLRVRADLGRDADVLAVAPDNPACADGLTRAAARGIASGKLRTWAAAGVSGPETISLVRKSNTAGDTAEPRFGASYKTPAGARRARDGGLSLVASGNSSVAAVTSWGKARIYGSSICVVKIGGVAPTDESVRSLRNPDSYPILYVTPRWIKPEASFRAIEKAFLKFLTGADAESQFKARGMLIRGASWPVTQGAG